jgi:hypothetical protein
MNLKLGDVVLHEWPDIPTQYGHPSICIIIDNASNCCYFAVTTSQTIKYSNIINIKVQQYTCYSREKMFFFPNSTQKFEKDSIILLKNPPESLDFSHIDHFGLKPIFSLDKSEFNCLLNCYEKSGEMKNYLIKLLKKMQ